MTETQLVMTYGEITKALGSVLGIPVGQHPALKARLKHLQSKGFPAGVNKGHRGVKYSVRDLCGLAVVMTLVSAFVPPYVAIGLVRANWMGVAKGLRAGNRPATGSVSVDVRDNAIAIFALNSLAEMGMKQKEKKPDSAKPNQKIEAETGRAFFVNRANLDKMTTESRNPSVMIDLTDLAGRVLEALPERKDTKPVSNLDSIDGQGTP